MFVPTLGIATDAGREVGAEGALDVDADEVPHAPVGLLALGTASPSRLLGVLDPPIRVEVDGWAP